MQLYPSLNLVTLAHPIALEGVRGQLAKQLFVIPGEVPKISKTVFVSNLFDQKVARVGTAPRTVKSIVNASTTEKRSTLNKRDEYGDLS